MNLAGLGVAEQDRSTGTPCAMGRTVGLIHSERERHVVSHPSEGLIWVWMAFLPHHPLPSGSSRVCDGEHRPQRQADQGSNVDTDPPAP